MRLNTYIILLSLEILSVIKLLSLQLHQPLPQLTGLLPFKQAAEDQRLTSKTWCEPAWQTDSDWWANLMPRTYFSLSSFKWSMLSGFLLSARIFLFFSLSVCFFAPFLPSCCKIQSMQNIVVDLKKKVLHKPPRKIWNKNIGNWPFAGHHIAESC